VPPVPALSIGTEVFRFDPERRVYAMVNGKATGGPTYRGQFLPCFVVGEEKRSWLVSQSPGGPMSFKWGKATPGLLSVEQVDELCWMHDHRISIARLLDTCRDPSIVRAVGALLGHGPSLETQHGHS
jgi:hypothetical protein